jgi:hypothetical protein
MAAATLKGNLGGSPSVPTDGTMAQVLTALGAVASSLSFASTSFSIPLVLSGVVVLLQVRMGNITLSSGSNVTFTPITFNPPFSTEFIGVVANQTTPADGSVWHPIIMGLEQGTGTTTGCSLQADTANNGYYVNSGDTAFYVAFGY